MMPSTLPCSQPSGLHVAIIMDGNGRWASARGLPRIAGHQAGADAVRRAVEAAPKSGIHTLTLYAFSSDNWQRPQQEVDALMQLFHTYLLKEAEECAANGIRINVIGRRDRLPAEVREAVELAESVTSLGQNLRLRIAVDYSARDAILRAASRLSADAQVTREEFAQLLAEVYHAAPPALDVDILVRTGGEQRLSDFLLWESAYAELVFTRRMWPDFDASDLEAAVKEFQARERRFGRIQEAVVV